MPVVILNIKSDYFIRKGKFTGVGYFCFGLMLICSKYLASLLLRKLITQLSDLLETETIVVKWDKLKRKQVK